VGLLDERKSEPKATEDVHKEHREVLSVHGSSMSGRERDRSVRKIYHFSSIFCFSLANLIVHSGPTSLARSAYSARRGREFFLLIVVATAKSGDRLFQFGSTFLLFLFLPFPPSPHSSIEMSVDLHSDIELPLARGAEPQKLTFIKVLHFLYLLIPRLCESLLSTKVYDIS